MEQIWFKDPAGLFTPTNWSQFVPVKEMTVAQALNSVVRFTSYFAVLLFLATGVTAYILAIPTVMVVTILLYSLFPNGKTIESFAATTAGAAVATTMPSANNPFMNVLLTEIMDDPDRPDAAPVTRSDVKSEMYKQFQKTTDMYMDTSDLFDQSQAMRTFHTLQSARVPNDLDGFKKWLAKGVDAPDFSTAPPARGGKILSEGYVKHPLNMSGDGSLAPSATKRLAPTNTTSKPTA
jgi:hypothetical protein